MKATISKLVHNAKENAELLYNAVTGSPKLRISAYPYISGDLFLALADVAVLQDRSEPIKLRSGNNLLFIETVLLENPINLRYALNFKAVIAHNGDYALSSNLIEQLNRAGVKLFAVNINEILPNVFVLPIGIENAHHRSNGSIDYFNPLSMANLTLQKKRDVLVSFRSSTNPLIREPIEKQFHMAGHKNMQLSIPKYRKMLALSRYCISPPGNGIDCHRTWEAFYHKTIPVVERQYWHFDRHDLPVLVVDNYSDFLAMNDQAKHDMYAKIISKPCDAIYFDYWLGLVLKEITL